MESEGVQIVDMKHLTDKDTDFSAQLTKIQQVKPDVICSCFSLPRRRIKSEKNA